MDTVSPPGRSPHWPPHAVEGVSRGGWLRLSEKEWRNALRASAMAPLDAGFVVRLREIAEAAARKAAALANLDDEEPEPWWQRQSGLPNGVLSYELRPAVTDPDRPSSGPRSMRPWSSSGSRWASTPYRLSGPPWSSCL